MGLTVQTSWQHMISFFLDFEALGLPMCHVIPVSGSSLPVSISIERWADHINLQAEVTISGIKVCSHMAGLKFQS